MLNEKYVPSPEEINKAEAMMTPKEELLSKLREEEYRGKKEASETEKIGKLFEEAVVPKLDADFEVEKLKIREGIVKKLSNKKLNREELLKEFEELYYPELIELIKKHQARDPSKPSEYFCRVLIKNLRAELITKGIVGASDDPEIKVYGCTDTALDYLKGVDMFVEYKDSAGNIKRITIDLKVKPPKGETPKADLIISGPKDYPTITNPESLAQWIDANVPEYAKFLIEFAHPTLERDIKIIEQMRSERDAIEAQKGIAKAIKKLKIAEHGLTEPEIRAVLFALHTKTGESTKEMTKKIEEAFKGADTKLNKN